MANYVERNSGKPELNGQGMGTVVMAMVAGLAALVILAGVMMRMGQATVATPELAPARITSFSTQQYWDLAKEAASANSAPAIPQTSNFSTQQYWDLAKATAPQASSFSTQQYWDLAKEATSGNNAPAAQTSSFSTQQYWDLAKQAEAGYATYTDRYWNQR